MTCPKTKWIQLIGDCDVKQTTNKNHRIWENRDKSEVREVNKQYCLTASKQNAPTCLWDFCAQYVCEL